MKKQKIIKILALGSLILSFGACSTSAEKRKLDEEKSAIDNKIAMDNQIINNMKQKQEAQQEAEMSGNVIGFANILRDIADNFNKVPAKYYGKGDGKKTRRGFAHVFSPVAVKADKAIKEIQSGAISSYLSKNGKSNPLINSFTKQSAYDNTLPKSVNLNNIKKRAIQVRDSINKDYSKYHQSEINQLNAQINNLDKLQKMAVDQEVDLVKSTSNAPLKINYKDKK